MAFAKNVIFFLKKCWFEVGQSKFKHPVGLCRVCRWFFSQKDFMHHYLAGQVNFCLFCLHNKLSNKIFFIYLYKDGTILKIPLEIYPPLLCIKSLLETMHLEIQFSELQFWSFITHTVKFRMLKLRSVKLVVLCSIY